MQKIKTAASALMLMGCMLLLAGCASLSTSISQFEKGDYVASVKSTLTYLDDKYKKPDYDDSDERNGVRERLRVIVASYEATIQGAGERDYDRKIGAYLALLDIRTALAARSYYPKYTDLPLRYTDATLRDTLASEYYQKASAAAAYKDERQAAISFAAAADIYQPYGDYKDARKQADKHRYAADSLDAAAYYKQGTELAANNPQRRRSIIAMPARLSTMPTTSIRNTVPTRMRRRFPTNIAHSALWCCRSAATIPTATSPAA